MRCDDIRLPPIVGAALVAVLVVVPGCSLITGLFSGRAINLGVERIAVVPFAYRGADDERRCDLCSRQIPLKVTSREDAAFISAFFFEQLTGYPRLIVSDTGRVDRLLDVSMAEGLDMFRAMDEVDAVLVGAVVDLRERAGSEFSPRKPAGVTLYAELIDAKTGKSLWTGTFDGNQQPRGRLKTAFGRVIRGGHMRWDSGLVFARKGAGKLVESMMNHIFAS